MSTNNSSIEFQEFIDQNKFSKFQWIIFIICFLVALLDGYDAFAIGYIAPSLINEWGIHKADLASAISAGLFGIITGAMASGPISDKYGRRIILIVSVFLFGFGTFISSYSQNLHQLTILRFITGIGLGAAIPCSVTLLTEYSPRNKKYFLVNTMFCGVPLGAALGGFLAAWLIPTFGWKSVLILGGIAPIILAVIAIIFIPESIYYAINKGIAQSTIQKTLRKISLSATQYSHVYLAEDDTTTQKNSGIKLIVSKHYVVGSLLLWITYFMGLLIFYGISTWMPTLFTTTNLNPSLASIITGLFALGGLGAIANGWLMDRYNPSVLVMTFFALTAICVAAIGLSINYSTTLLVTVTILAGVVMNTAQSSLPSFAANFYPSTGRSTGVSWMLGFGRFGGIAGAYLVAELIKKDLTLENIFLILSIPAIISTMCFLIIYLFYFRNTKTDTTVNTTLNKTT